MCLVARGTVWRCVHLPRLRENLLESVDAFRESLAERCVREEEVSRWGSKGSRKEGPLPLSRDFSFARLRSGLFLETHLSTDLSTALNSRSESESSSLQRASSLSFK